MEYVALFRHNQSGDDVRRKIQKPAVT